MAPGHLTPDVVVPALRGGFGREYHYAAVTETTQRMLPGDAAHGAVALAEHQTAGRGRLGRVWVDEPGAGLTFSVALRPPQPVSRWPELTLLAADAVAASIGPSAAIKHPNDVLVAGLKVAGILAEAAERVVLGIGINVGRAAWPGAGAVDRDRLELLVEVLYRLEGAYETWAGCGSAQPVTTALRLPPASSACAVNDEIATVGLIVKTPDGSGWRMVVVPFSSSVTAAGSLSENVSVAPLTRVSTGGVVSIVTDTDLRDGAEPVRDRDHCGVRPVGKLGAVRGAVPDHRVRPQSELALERRGDDGTALLDVEPHRHVLRHARTRARPCRSRRRRSARSQTATRPGRRASCRPRAGSPS